MLMRMAGSLPRLPQRFMVRGETRRISATSRIVKRSGKSESDILLLLLFDRDMVGIIKHYISIVKGFLSGRICLLIFEKVIVQ